MTKIYLGRRLLAIAIFAVTITANYFNWSVNSQEVSAPSVNKDLSRNKSNATAQTLIGGWTGKSYIDIDHGEHRQQTTFFEPDGTYSSIISGQVGWYLADRGTWSLENNTLYQTSEMTGKKSQGAMNFASQDKYVYVSSTSNDETIWQKVAPKPNLSAEQLVGTWAIEPLDIKDGRVVPDLSHFTKMELKLVELNADGTFRYQSSNLTVPGYLKEGNANGTWEYINNGFADGILILKNSQGQTISVSSVNWSSQGDYFVNINRTDFDPAQNKWITGKAEKFIPTDQNIN